MAEATPPFPAGEIRLALQAKYTEITDVLDVEELSAKLYAAALISLEDLQNLQQDTSRVGTITRAKMLVEKLLHKSDQGLERCIEIAVTHQPGISSYIEETKSNLHSCIPSMASHLKDLHKQRQYNLVQALPGETFQLDLHIPDYIMPLEFSAEKLDQSFYISEDCKSIFDFSSFLLASKSLSSVLCTGIAGIGKSIYSQQVLCMWVDSDERLSGYLLVFLIPVRSIDVNASLVNILGESLGGLGLIKEDMKDAFRLCLQDETIANKFLFVLDGIDEKDIPLESELSDVITGKKYKHIKLIITARPEASFLQKSQGFKPDYKVQLLGTNEEGVHGFLKAMMQNGDKIPDSDQIDKLIEECNESMIAFDMLQIPLYLTLVGVLFSHHWAKHLTFTNFQIPKTTTNLFNAIVHILLRKWLIRTGYIDEATSLQFQSNPISVQSNLPNPFKNKLFAFGKMSFNLLQEESYTFTTTTLKQYMIDEQDIHQSGLFCTSEEEGEIVCFYRHKTLQEFMAALYLACEPKHIYDIIENRLQPDDSLGDKFNRQFKHRSVFSEVFSGLRVVAKFIFGIDCDVSLAILQQLRSKIFISKRKKYYPLNGVIYPVDRGINISMESILFSEVEDASLKDTMLEILSQAEMKYFFRKDKYNVFVSNSNCFATLCNTFSVDQKIALLTKWFNLRLVKHHGSWNISKDDALNLGYCGQVLFLLNGFKFPKIRILYIQETDILHTGFFQKIFPKMHQLEIHGYENSGNDGVAAKMLAKALRGGQQIRPTLTQVTIKKNRNKYNRQDVTMHIDALEHLTKQSELQTLRLCRVNILRKIQQVKNSATCFWRNLIVLELYLNVANDESGNSQLENLIWLIENHTPSLQSLTVGNTCFYAKFSNRLGDLLHEKAARSPFKQLTTLRLFKVLDHTDMGKLCDALPYMSALTTLGVHCYEIGYEKLAKDLIDAISGCQNITHIHIGHNYKPSKAKSAISRLDSIVKSLPVKPKLQFSTYNIHSFKLIDHTSCTIQ